MKVDFSSRKMWFGVVVEKIGKYNLTYNTNALKCFKIEYASHVRNTSECVICEHASHLRDICDYVINVDDLSV